MVKVGKVPPTCGPPGEEVYSLPIKYKIDILEALKVAGYNTSRLRKEKLLGESVIQKMREKKPLSWHEMGTICGLLGCQPGDLVEYVQEEQPQE